jgi:hypothetical protein
MDPSPPPLNLLEIFSSIGIDVGHPSWDPPGF